MYTELYNNIRYIRCILTFFFSQAAAKLCHGNHRKVRLETGREIAVKPRNLQLINSWERVWCPKLPS